MTSYAQSFGLGTGTGLRSKGGAQTGVERNADPMTPLAQDPSAAETYPTASALDTLVARAEAAAAFLKALGHDGRLTILCHLIGGPKSVTELENLLSSRQAVVSQQLARLRLEGLVSARREGQAIFYSIRDPAVRETIALLARLFCEPAQDR